MKGVGAFCKFSYVIFTITQRPSVEREGDSRNVWQCLGTVWGVTKVGGMLMASQGSSRDVLLTSPSTVPGQARWRANLPKCQHAKAGEP